MQIGASDWLYCPRSFLHLEFRARAKSLGQPQMKELGQYCQSASPLGTFYLYLSNCSFSDPSVMCSRYCKADVIFFGIFDLISL